MATKRGTTPGGWSKRYPMVWHCPGHGPCSRGWHFTGLAGVCVGPYRTVKSADEARVRLAQMRKARSSVSFVLDPLHDGRCAGWYWWDSSGSMRGTGGGRGFPSRAAAEVAEDAG